MVHLAPVRTFNFLPSVAIGRRSSEIQAEDEYSLWLSAKMVDSKAHLWQFRRIYLHVIAFQAGLHPILMPDRASF
jgi:hypothetical protein